MVRRAGSLRRFRDIKRGSFLTNRKSDTYQHRSTPMIVLAIDKLKHPTVRISVVKEGVFSPGNHLQVGLVGCGLLRDSSRMI
ncbi:hypothetical protein GJAV_G00138900 [Gymnothorax javanicus]|nr:hypothetical protein GJAV_G00138900 [Gymnothorax javanicus]